MRPLGPEVIRFVQWSLIHPSTQMLSIYTFGTSTRLDVVLLHMSSLRPAAPLKWPEKRMGEEHSRLSYFNYFEKFLPMS
jgi:hypothetical protein